METGVNFGDPSYYARVDESDDALFYQMPRLVIHVDDHASDALVEYFAGALPAGGRVLDLMSSYRSHLVEHGGHGDVIGLGMNVAELRQNPALAAGIIQDINKLPTLPFADTVFDACILSFSMQYLTQPIAVLAEVARCLKPGGTFFTSYSNRLFPTKAVAVWRSCSDAQRAQLIGQYLDETGAYADIQGQQLVDAASGFDPLYVVSGTKRSA
ncbi:MAG: methyltransferase domain-containing protein [Rhodospirillaceae bacterium]|nr:methyltransferase domain-containing protein [Rhodospirillaceae bacterium]